MGCDHRGARGAPPAPQDWGGARVSLPISTWPLPSPTLLPRQCLHASSTSEVFTDMTFRRPHLCQCIPWAAPPWAAPQGQVFWPHPDSSLAPCALPPPTLWCCVTWAQTLGFSVPRCPCSRMEVLEHTLGMSGQDKRHWAQPALGTLRTDQGAWLGSQSP